MDFEDREPSLAGVLPGTHVMTLNLSGGTGGMGGRGLQQGGIGGTGEGSRLYVSSADRWTVHVNGNLNYSRDEISMVDSNFRRIPWGDVELQRRLYVDDPKLDPFPRRRRQERCARIVRSAKIDGREFTVANYEGHSAEEDWKQDVERYMDIRHENILQMYGTVCSRNVRAAVFHGDFLSMYDGCAMSTCFIYTYINREFKDTKTYFERTLGSSLPTCTLLIRRSTGHLCLDLSGRDFFGLNMKSTSDLVPTTSPMQILSSTNRNDIAKNMALEEYYFICKLQLSAMEQTIPLPSYSTIHVGALYCDISDELRRAVQVMALPGFDCDVEEEWEYTSDDYSMTPDGWMCIPYSSTDDIQTFSVSIAFAESTWLSQANHIFKRLNVESDFHRYAILDEISFNITLDDPEDTTFNDPQGYLLLCPTRDLKLGSNSFQWSECPAYWSLDPCGMEQLTPDGARELGFPTIVTETQAHFLSWDGIVYRGLCEFHRGKGFDSESLDVAIHLNAPLYELFSDEPPIVVEDNETESECGSEDGGDVSEKECQDLFEPMELDEVTSIEFPLGEELGHIQTAYMPPLARLPVKRRAELDIEESESGNIAKRRRF
ncbi:hypothetical protein R3P38DRAFT_1962222 [Favolaschia claudopus]|uniref:Uncharacterized protein n=1 Tax=Favolaschia claudopus TaxID=2862362 RepID=A0AAW0A0I0_9AGAR